MNSISVKRHRFSTKRRWLFGLLLTVIVWIILEIVSLAALMLAEKEISYRSIRLRQTETATGKHVSRGAGETIHPYLGWIHNPQIASIERFEGRDIPVNPLGFRDDSDGVYRRSDDLFIVGIAGGSVAFQFSWAAEELLRERLSAHPRVKGRTIRFVRMALSGYKQPQQLMALNYLLALGAEFDLVINIDGFNETTLSLLENTSQATFFAYPRSWHARSIMMVDPRDSADAARLLFLRGKRQQMGRTILNSWFRWSPAFNLVWYVRDQMVFSELTDLGISISENRRKSFVHHGPANVHDGAELDDDVVLFWMRSSLQMHYLCINNQIHYLHVLQPNQYVPDSKPMDEDERNTCFDEKSEIGPLVERLFPKLQTQGSELSRMGVHFSDQTLVFSQTNAPLYIDPWCHFNREGNRILCESIATKVLEMLNSPAGGSEMSR